MAGGKTPERLGQRSALLPGWRPKERPPRLGTRLPTAEQEAAAAQLPDVTLDVDAFKPPPSGQRGKLLALALLTATLLWLLLLYRPGRTLPAPAVAASAPVPEAAAVAPGPQACAPGQSRDCIGGTATVTLLPATPAAPAASR